MVGIYEESGSEGWVVRILLVNIPSVIDFVHQKDIIFFVDAENDPHLSRTHPQKALPFTLKPFYIEFLEGNDALLFDGADKGLEFEPYPLLAFPIELVEKLDRSVMEPDPHSLIQSVMSVKSSSL